ncbi:MAG TPA: hypothetical protein VJ998_05815, partial [Pseudomonadales bacterium]|nr:hypothetical protein [Pseudomonadales bacterium]
ALGRELREELSVDLESCELLTVAMHHYYPDILVLVYGCHISGLASLAVSSEHAELHSFPFEDLPLASIPSPYIEPIKMWHEHVET